MFVNETVRRNMTDDPAQHGLPEGWSYSGASITRTFHFATFSEAFGFMTRCARLAEQLNHHPDWSNSYSVVTVSLSTHDLGAVTALDLQFAEQMNDLVDASGD